MQQKQESSWGGRRAIQILKPLLKPHLIGMQPLFIQPSRLNGRLCIPSSKSHTMRALLFAAMGEGESVIEDYLEAQDTYTMIEGLSTFGIKIDKRGNRLLVQGGSLHPPDDVINAGNSGQVLRFLAALAPHASGWTVITGDASLRFRRPMEPLLEGLRQLGVSAFSTKGDGYAPVIIGGHYQTQRRCKIQGNDSQPVSALLMGCAFLPEKTSIEVETPHERPWIGLTLDWLQRMGTRVEYDEDFTLFEVEGGLKVTPFHWRVPGDWSSAAFGMVAALVTRSKLVLENLDPHDIQGDRVVVRLLQEMGAPIEKQERSLVIDGTQQLLEGIEVDMDQAIDALPILTVAAVYASTPSRLYNARAARYKESDRLKAISQELQKMGAKIEERDDELIIHPSQLHGADLYAHEDHRIAMSLIVAALGADSQSTVSGGEMIYKSYPHFVRDFQKIGAWITSSSLE